MEERQNDNDELCSSFDELIRKEHSPVDKQRLIEVWSKVQIAEIMQKHAKSLLDSAQTDLEFYKLIRAERELNDGLQ
jgi:hypothetical protein